MALRAPGSVRATGKELHMIRRIAPILCAVVLALTASAWAQTEVRGVVSRVDPVNRNVYFTDGRVIHLTPGSTLTIDGKPGRLESVTPGMSLVLFPAGTSTTTVTTVTQPVQVVPAPAPAVVAPAPVTLPAPAPVNVTGTIARTDPLSQTITFQDGRIVKIGPHTMVWQQAPAISSLLPGAQVFVRDAVPVGYLPSGAASALPPGQWMMGTVSRVEPATQQIVLGNGAVVYVGPSATVRSGSERVAITHLRPGDEILVQMRPVTVAPSSGVTVLAPVPTTSDRYVGSALPYQTYGVTRIEASDVQVMWSPQSR
jgi:hypothetical protein